MSTHEEGGRERLNRTKVLTAAIAFADESGLDALSMRALAARLQVVPMALYKHVTDKDDLLGGMVDTIVADFQEPQAEAGWRLRVRSRVLTARDAITKHPWLGQAIDSRVHRTETIYRYMNAVAGDFIGGGISADLTHYAMHALGTRIWGFSTEAFDDPNAPTPKDVDQTELVQYMTDHYPHVVAIAMDASERNPTPGCHEQSEFEFTLDLLLDGFERLHDAGWESRPRRVCS